MKCVLFRNAKLQRTWFSPTDDLVARGQKRRKCHEAFI